MGGHWIYIDAFKFCLKYQGTNYLNSSQIGLKMKVKSAPKNKNKKIINKFFFMYSPFDQPKTGLKN